MYCLLGDIEGFDIINRSFVFSKLDVYICVILELVYL